MVRRARMVALFLVSVFVMALAGCGKSAAPKTPPSGGSDSGGKVTQTEPVKPVKLNWLIVAKSVSYLNFYAANEKGFFKKEGIELDLTYTSSSERAVQSLLGSSGDIGIMTTDQTILAIDKGAGLVMVGATTLLPPYTLMVQPGITSYEQLKGKTFGQSNTRTAEVVFLRDMLAKHGLQQDRDYTVIVPGSLPQRVAAVRAKAVDGSLLNEPYVSELAKDGYVKLGSANDTVKDYQFASIAVRKDWAASNKDTIVRVLRGIAKATDWLYDPANKAEATKMIQDVTGFSAEGSSAAYQDYVVVGKVFPPKAGVSKEGMLKVMEFMKDSGSPAAKADPFGYVDMQFLEAAAK